MDYLVHAMGEAVMRHLEMKERAKEPTSWVDIVGLTGMTIFWIAIGIAVAN